MKNKGSCFGEGYLHTNSIKLPYLAFSMTSHICIPSPSSIFTIPYDATTQGLFIASNMNASCSTATLNFSNSSDSSDIGLIGLKILTATRFRCKRAEYTVPYRPLPSSSSFPSSCSNTMSFCSTILYNSFILAFNTAFLFSFIDFLSDNAFTMSLMSLMPSCMSSMPPCRRSVSAMISSVDSWCISS